MLPKQLAQIILSSKILCKSLTKTDYWFLPNLGKHYVPHENISFMYLFDWWLYMTILSTTSSPFIFEQSSYILVKRLKNVFKYLQLNNFVICARRLDQLRRVITIENLKLPLKVSWVVRMWNCRYHPVMNGLDNAVIMEVLSWKRKFSVNGRLRSRKSSPKFDFKKWIKNVIKRNSVKWYMVCLFNKFVRYFLEQIQCHTLYSLNKSDFSLGLQKTFNLQMNALQNNAILKFST